MKILLVIAMLTNYVFATDFLFYCDAEFSNLSTFNQAIKILGNEDFELEESTVKLRFDSSNVKSEFNNLRINGEIVKLSTLSAKEEAVIVDAVSASGKGSGRHGLGYRFSSESACIDSKGKMEQYNIGGIAGGKTVQTLNCVCSIK